MIQTLHVKVGQQSLRCYIVLQLSPCSSQNHNQTETMYSVLLAKTFILSDSVHSTQDQLFLFCFFSQSFILGINAI